MKKIDFNKHFQRGELTSVADNPWLQFANWLHEAEQALPDCFFNAMTLATVSADHKPSARMVLLKEYSEDGLVFYTNYQSHKGEDIAANPQVALLFWWEALDRQIRIEGTAEKISVEKSTEYFHSRSKHSQIAACISNQSQPIVDKQVLLDTYQAMCRQYDPSSAVIPKPAHWGGYLVKPESFEFWQGGEHRLHDRFLYQRQTMGEWQITRLSP